MSIQQVDKCVNCNVCRIICPKNAVSFEKDEDGFKNPSVDSKKCIECGLCEKYCLANKQENVQNLHAAYYGRTKNEETLKLSSSGGIFSEIAEKVIEEGGIVYGAVFDYKNKSVIFGGSDDYNLDEIRRSKYVESNVGEIYIRIKEQLDTGRTVLFTGAPCQVWGLKTYLKKDYKNLICCDFFCGGMPSESIFKVYLTHLEDLYKSKITHINFRTKIYGWTRMAIQIKFSNGKKYTKYAFLDPFFRGYMYEQILKREACYECQFSTNHYSDIIIADFWGYRQLEGFVNDEKGVSIVVTNSDKGEAFISGLDGADLKKIPLKYAEYSFKEKKPDDNIMKKREAFFKEFKKCGFEKAAKKTYMKKCNSFRIKRLVAKLIGKE